MLTDGSGTGTNFASTGITAANMENVVITTADTQATPSGTFNGSVTLLGNSSSSITVAGNAGLSLTATSTRLTTVNASGITLGGFSWTTGALAAAASITGSASGTNIVDFSSANGGAVTYTGGAGADTITTSNNKNNVINGGNGSNSVNATGSGNQTVTGGTGSDTIVVGNGNNTIITGDGTDTVTTGTGINTITTGTGSESITVGAGSNIITLGAHGVGTADSVRAAASLAGSYVPTATITGMSTVGLDTITFAGDLTANSFTVFTALQLVDFGAATGIEINGAGPATLAEAVGDVLSSLGGNLARHGIGAFQFGGDTYLVEQAAVAGTAFGAGDTLVKLTGTPTISTTSVASGILHLLT